jgi:predicted alpha/beta hydrolase
MLFVMEELFITADDGYQLSALYCTPTRKRAGDIVISSATGIKKEYYINFANFLAQRGYAVLLFDYRGIGGSAPDDLKKSSAYMHEWGTKDMNAVVNYLVEEKEVIDIIWVGHSVGAQLVGFLDHPQYIRKVIAINAALGYWGYFPFPAKFMIWFLWYLVGPLMVKLYGYGKMKKIGWGEDLPRNMMREWREWCLSKNYFRSCLQKQLKTDKFYGFTPPVVSIYTSDDYLANDKTVPLMMDFFPNSYQEIFKLPVEKFTSEKVGHIGIFRKKFRKNLWPILVYLIERRIMTKEFTGKVSEPRSYQRTAL